MLLGGGADVVPQADFLPGSLGPLDGERRPVVEVVQRQRANVHLVLELMGTREILAGERSGA
jgi:hypothetical protein